MSARQILGCVIGSTIFVSMCLSLLFYAIFAPIPWFKATETPAPLSKNSAIKKAKNLSYAVKELNLFSCLSIPENTCDNFFDRFYASDKTKTALIKALGHARQKEIFIFATNRFKIGSGYILIDANATDEKIINFLLEKGETR